MSSSLFSSTTTTTTAATTSSTSFSWSQSVALAVTPKVSSTISIISSSWIIIEVLSQPLKRQNTYNRLLLAMSICDVSTAIWFFMSTWPIPATESSSGVAFAVGNQATCSVQGFFLQGGIVSPIYNTCLAVYYLLVVKGYGTTSHGNTSTTARSATERFRTIEYIMHFVALSFGFGTSIASVYLKLFNNANLWCWIASYPSNCQDSFTYGKDQSTCIRGDNAWIYRWAFFFAPLWLCIVLVTGIMIVVYRTVRQNELQTLVGTKTMTKSSNRFLLLPWKHKKNTDDDDDDDKDNNRRRSTTATHGRNFSIIVNPTSEDHNTAAAAAAAATARTTSPKKRPITAATITLAGTIVDLGSETEFENRNKNKNKNNNQMQNYAKPKDPARQEQEQPLSMTSPPSSPSNTTTDRVPVTTPTPYGLSMFTPEKEEEEEEDRQTEMNTLRRGRRRPRGRREDQSLTISSLATDVTNKNQNAYDSYNINNNDDSRSGSFQVSQQRLFMHYQEMSDLFKSMTDVNLHEVDDTIIPSMTMMMMSKNGIEMDMNDDNDNDDTIHRNINNNNKEDTDHVLQTIQQYVSANDQATAAVHMGSSMFGSRAVYQQSLYYTIGFYVTFVFATLNRILQQVTGRTFFPVILLHCLFIPLQGFFNLLVYRYYFFSRLRQRNPHMTFRELFKYTFRWTFLGPPPDEGDAQDKKKQNSNGDSTITEPTRTSSTWGWSTVSNRLSWLSSSQRNQQRQPSNQTSSIIGRDDNRTVSDTVKSTSQDDDPKNQGRFVPSSIYESDSSILTSNSSSNNNNNNNSARESTVANSYVSSNTNNNVNILYDDVMGDDNLGMNGVVDLPVIDEHDDNMQGHGCSDVTSAGYDMNGSGRSPHNQRQQRHHNNATNYAQSTATAAGGSSSSNSNVVDCGMPPPPQQYPVFVKRDSYEGQTIPGFDDNSKELLYHHRYSSDERNLSNATTTAATAAAATMTTTGQQQQQQWETDSDSS